MFSKVLIANRGAIACRIMRTLRKLDVAPVVIYSEADRESLHVLEAPEAIALGGNKAAESYLDVQKVLAAAKESGAEAIHPGYGFLSESSDFAKACEAAGLVFLGPTPSQLENCGLKHVCRDMARASSVPLLEGSPLLESAKDALTAAEAIGYPVILKSSAGGGGIGMKIAQNSEELPELFDQVRRLAEANFGDGGVFLEKFVERARHLEVQVFGDGEGGVVSLGERDCSTQRRNQKVIEETPAPGLSDAERESLSEAAKRLVQSVNYRSAGTVEFLWDDLAREFYFLEINARLQVEHGVTEAVTGVDLVEWMVRLGAGDLAPLSELSANIQSQGHSIQARLYAEDPKKDFQPNAGLVTHFAAPEGVRCDTWIESGTEVSGYYDPMIAKVIAHEADRESAKARLTQALEELTCAGIETNQAYLRQILASEAFGAGQITTRFLNDFPYHAATVDVLDAGLETTIQDYPGRIGMWDVGVPPSGPFDILSFRLGNRILGNDSAAAGLEMTVKGAKLRFNQATQICLTGADMEAKLDGELINSYQCVPVEEGQVLKLGGVQGSGQRAYLLVAGGFQVPEHLGSRATFRLGRFGGHGGRVLRVGDVLHLDPEASADPEVLPEALIPELTNAWELRVVYGPHGSPEFFTEEDIQTFFEASWEVHYNSDRTGVRLIGPKPKWARQDGGEAGLHPSNIHDNAYCVGSVDFTGDMPIILGPDGPSLGGFVCPAVMAKADLWKIGQLKPGDRVRFRAVTNAEAEQAWRDQDQSVTSLELSGSEISGTEQPTEAPILDIIGPTETSPQVCFRQSGDGVILIEYGDLVLDLDLRFRVQGLYEWLQAHPFEGMMELVPGIRSLQVQFEPSIISGPKVLKLIEEAEKELPPVTELEFPSRIVHLPLSWDDPATQEAIRKYMQIVRADAPWCPSNIEFIRKINGLESHEEVKRIVYDASYFVLGLGDVYLGAPVATPLDPRHRLVTTKYNPARTWTPENAVGIGGAYLCIYGMEGPGGYQFVGRTLPIWNRFKTTDEFVPGKPWLLRFFDQIRWFPVEAEELLEMRRQFLTGQYSIEIEETTFKPGDYHAFLDENADEIAAFRKQQRDAFAAEREHWEATGAMSYASQVPDAAPVDEAKVEIPEGCESADAPVSGSVWKLLVEPGAEVEEDQPLIIVESMKMEISVCAPSAGIVKDLLAVEGKPVSAGQPLAIIEPNA